MERNSLSSNLKHHSIGGGRSLKDNLNNNNNNNRVNKDSWEYSSSCSEMMSHGGGGGGGGGDLLSGFPWPPRCHTCSFCKREFRSAQALGGHMNVHRRERARLRQSPPPRDGHDHHQYPFLNLNLNPNPNPYPYPNPNSSPSQNPDHPSSSQSPSPSSTRFPPFTSTLLPLVSPSTSLSSLSLPHSSASPSEINKWVMEIDTDLAKIKSSETLLRAREFEGFAQASECEVLKGKIVGLDLEIGLCSDSKDDLDLELRLGRS